MLRVAIQSLLALAVLTTSVRAAQRAHVIVIVGATGTPEYGEQFSEWAAQWKQAAERAEASFAGVGPGYSDGDTPDRELLKQQLDSELAKSAETLWLVLIGHGTFDGQRAKFNLRGPDVSAQELADWLADREGPLAVINCASASGPFINRLAGPNRIIVSSTKSGYEYNFARFGQYLAASIADEEVDLDKDEQTSLLEAFLAASSRVQEFYTQEARLATEHALLEDNGDGLGTPADWFRGVRATKAAKDGAQPDGLRANQWFLVRRGSEATIPAETQQRRNELEIQLEQLRQQKAEMTETEYYDRLEFVLVDLAHLYEQLETPQPKQNGRPPEPTNTPELQEPSQKQEAYQPSEPISGYGRPPEPTSGHGRPPEPPSPLSRDGRPPEPAQ